jgi:hypothetical protein
MITPQFCTEDKEVNFKVHLEGMGCRDVRWMGWAYLNCRIKANVLV